MLASNNTTFQITETGENICFIETLKVSVKLISTRMLHLVYSQ